MVAIRNQADNNVGELGHDALEEALHAISSFNVASHLEREKALHRFSSQLSMLHTEGVGRIKEQILSQMQDSQSWQSIHSSTRAAQAVLNFDRETESLDPDFVDHLEKRCIELMKHEEARVRESTSFLIQDLATIDPASAWNDVLPKLLEHASANFTLDDSQRLAEATRIAEQDADSAAAVAKRGHQLLHETEGWRGLETTLLALGRLVRGCALVAIPDSNCPTEVLDQLLASVKRAHTHPNRFVREAGLKLLDAVGTAARETNADLEVHCLVERIAHDTIEPLKAGLQDNWSQVRFAASVATRTLLADIPAEKRRPFYQVLLGRMCLNRHYVAEGVRNYSQETWRTVVGTEGRQYLNEFLEDIVAFYESQTEADNHAVREAACQSLGEVALRLDTNRVRPLLLNIVRGLVSCFKDESWPVRDHACRALADVISAFPAESELTGELNETFDLFVRHLSDNIPSVRENCASCLVRACLAYDDDHPVMGIARLRGVIGDHVKGIQEQKEGISTQSTTTNTQFGASTVLAKDHIDNDAAHTNQVMYSCGSLAPKLRRGGGCSDHGFVREKEGWEVSEGGLNVWRVLLNAGPRGRAMGCGFVAAVVDAGLSGTEKGFRWRGKFLLAVLKSLNWAKRHGGSSIAEELECERGRIAQLCTFAQSEDAENVQRAGIECARLVTSF